MSVSNRLILILPIAILPLLSIAGTDAVALRYRIEISTMPMAEKISARSYENQIKLHFGDYELVEMAGECRAIVSALDGGSEATLQVQMSRITDDGVETDLGNRELTVPYLMSGMVSWPAGDDLACNFYYSIAKNDFPKPY